MTVIFQGRTYTSEQWQASGYTSKYNIEYMRNSDGDKVAYITGSKQQIQARQKARQENFEQYVERNYSQPAQQAPEYAANIVNYSALSPLARQKVEQAMAPAPTREPKKAYTKTEQDIRAGRLKASGGFFSTSDGYATAAAKEALEADYLQRLGAAAKRGESVALPEDAAQRAQVIKAAKAGLVARTARKRYEREQIPEESVQWIVYKDATGQPVTEPSDAMFLSFGQVTFKEPDNQSYVEFTPPIKNNAVAWLSDKYNTANQKLRPITEKAAATFIDKDFLEGNPRYTEFAESNPIYMGTEGAIKGFVSDVQKKPIKGVALAAAGFAGQGLGTVAQGSRAASAVFTTGAYALTGVYASVKSYEILKAPTAQSKGEIVGHVAYEVGSMRLGAFAFNKGADVVAQLRGGTKLTAEIKTDDWYEQARATAGSKSDILTLRQTSPYQVYRVEGIYRGSNYRALVVADSQSGISRATITYKGKVTTKLWQAKNPALFKPEALEPKIKAMLKPAKGEPGQSSLVYTQQFKAQASSSKSFLKEGYQTTVTYKAENIQYAYSRAYSTPQISNIKVSDAGVVTYNVKVTQPTFDFGKGKLQPDVFIFEKTDSGYIAGKVTQPRLQQLTRITSQSRIKYTYSVKYADLPSFNKKGSLNLKTVTRPSKIYLEPELKTESSLPSFNKKGSLNLKTVTQPSKIYLAPELKTESSLINWNILIPSSQAVPTLAPVTLGAFATSSAQPAKSAINIKPVTVQPLASTLIVSNISAFESRIITSPESKAAPKTKSEPVVKSVTKPVTQAITQPVTKPVTQAITQPVTEPVVQPLSKMIISPVNILTPNIPRLAPGLPLFPGSQQGKERGFNVLMKEGGRVVRANEQPLPRSEAYRLGKDIADNSLSASFRLSRTKSMVPSARRSRLATGLNVSDSKFSQSRGWTVEKRRFRLDTPGEKRGIKASRLIADRRKSLFKTIWG